MAVAALTVAGLGKVLDALWAFSSDGDVTDAAQRSAGRSVAAILAICALIAGRGERLTEGAVRG